MLQNEVDDLPKVSVIIPCYNHDKYIKKAILSVLNQSYSNIELIVIDDGSKDNSVKIIEGINTLYNNKFIFIKQSNIGLSSTLNKALHIASGKYFTTCASDDLLHESKIEKQITFFKSNPSYKICFSKAGIINENGDYCVKETKSLSTFNTNNDMFNDILTFKYHPPVSFMFQKDILFENGIYEDNCFAEDFYMNLKLSKGYSFGYIAEELYYYRMELSAGLGHASRMPMRFEASESHFATLQGYTTEPMYPIAIQNWNFRRFMYFAAFKKFKLYALKGMVSSYKLIYKKEYLKSFFVLVFVWK
ncbi:glycosyltransferase family 2 protein [Shewanella frigidimarina]|uniref:glycosyltransferase family 2 protein n=1 Tax=Shewanella frigidimarina TaxID=56812 RepID=UPI003D7A3522